MEPRPLCSALAEGPGPELLWLLRHGTSQGNDAGRAAWRAGSLDVDLDDRDADVDLTDDGRHQARAVGAWMASLPPHQRPTVVLTSPYRRAVATAQPVVDALRAAPGGPGASGGPDAAGPLFRSDDRLRERDQGALERLTGRGIRERLPAEAQRKEQIGKVWYRPPGGESWADVLLRVRSLLGLEMPRFAGERVLLVSHQAVIMNVRVALEGLDEAAAVHVDESDPQPNCALTRYSGGPGGLALQAYADTGPVRRGAALLAARR